MRIIVIPTVLLEIGTGAFKKGFLAMSFPKNTIITKRDKTHTFNSVFSRNWNTNFIFNYMNESQRSRLFCSSSFSFQIRKNQVLKNLLSHCGFGLSGD